MDASLKQIQELLEKNSALLSQKTVAAGFDGFVDTVIRVIKTKSEANEPEYFKEIKEFGNYIAEKDGISFSLETDELFQKLGGNMPILSNALAHFGVKVNCMGAFGDPTIHPAFHSMHAGCKLYSFTSPGITSALEFANGKMLLGQMKDLNLADWNSVKNKIPIEKIIDIYKSSDIFCFVNWGEVDRSSDIWQGVLADVIPRIAATPRSKKAFFDLSDCSKRTSEAIKEGLSIIESFNQVVAVTLSLNKNEAQQVYTTFIDVAPPESLEILGKEIFRKLNIKNLVIHTSKQAYGWNTESVYKSASYSIKNPKIITGAGDNFNAGICLGLLLELDLHHCLSLGNAIAACYISNGKSPSVNELQLNSSQQ